jgi:hypothetical protein
VLNQRDKRAFLIPSRRPWRWCPTKANPPYPNNGLRHRSWRVDLGLREDAPTHSFDQSYALGQWESLEVYLKEPEIEIDNNLVENAIRPTALGKKNWLFFGDADAGERSAIIYSIIESCRRHGIEPYTYLHDILTRLPSMTNRQIKDVVPKAWAAARRNSALRVA